MATIRVLGSIYSPSEEAVLYAQVLDDAGEPVSTATITLTLFKKDGTKYLDTITMSYITGSNGMYKYEFIAPSEVQRMVADVKSTDPLAYSSEDIYVAEWTKDIGEVEAEVESLPGASFTI